MLRLCETTLRRLAFYSGFVEPVERRMNRNLVAFSAIALAAVCFAIAFLIPTGRGKAHFGRVVGLGTMESDTGSYPLGYVVEGREHYQIRLPRENACKVGSPIDFLEVPHLLGASFEPGFPPCPNARGGNQADGRS